MDTLDEVDTDDDVDTELEVETLEGKYSDYLEVFEYCWDKTVEILNGNKSVPFRKLNC